MKRSILILTLLLSGILMMTASASSPQKYFDAMANESEFNYSYISPTMLKGMGDRVVNYDLQIRASDINSIETVYTQTDGTNDKLWKAIRGLKQNKKMETLSTRKQGNYRFDVLGKLTGDGQTITDLMVVTQNTGACVTVVYIEGRIPISDIRVNF